MILGMRVKDCPKKKRKKVAYNVPVRRETQRMPQKELKWHTVHMLGTRVKDCRDEGNIARIGESKI